ncbi:leucine-rich repeat-containing protein kinase family protein [Leptothoe sp. PORK10 BA2]|uniref:leucine-rich repeat-containing protein kinase family protein n=1 Tax=Leptothoe sp. PORK10 BA2 TaxID=3110254 RepID=UPI002B21C8FC|nr:leucine-rich repeat-containing protein kinase family protein [Leptothoe sp. PORK10 BA2]MEA5465645.1 leucine-rich repeat-containing protein kinase family protein [Leptothoe sp. PORK10 BA2]
MKPLSLDLNHAMGEPRLQLAQNLTEFPLEILDLADSLEILDLSNNQLSTLPDEFSQLKNLKVAFFNNNQFETFPEVLAACPNLSMVSFKSNKIKTIGETALSPNLRWLILTNNQLTTLPKTIGKLTKLQKCMLAGNQLHTLPEELANCTNLELIRLAANQLQTIPPWLFTLPRLTWLAYAGNPCCTTANPPQTAPHNQVSLATIDPAELQLGEVLGQGASGVIYKGLWEPGTTAEALQQRNPQDVAVKLFKGEITSDGVPLDEMQACIAAADHPNLVKVLGKLAQPIADQAGLVFSFITPDYVNLGRPPSLDTCTRDTYGDDTTFTLPVILKIAQGIASVVTHLHTQGIMHGDLYAHNILVNNQGESILGDFGAASFYDPSNPAIARSLERLEVRAYGCLLEDLLERHVSKNEETEVKIFRRLRKLQQHCMDPIPSERPLFSTINQLLTEVSTFV